MKILIKPIFAIAILSLLTSCVSTPEQPITVNKELDGNQKSIVMERPKDTKSKFYTHAPLFTMRASETVSKQTIERLGPIGISLNILQPGFRMQIGLVEEGSPAAATGKLKKGQFIESINGQKLEKIDPRFQLASIITKAEATDGIVRLMIKEDADSKPFPVDVKLPILGEYSETWPLNCKKSDRIVRDLADYLAKTGWGDGHCGLNGPAMLFLLSTGEEKDLKIVREWIKKTIEFYKTNPAPFKNWRLGYGGISLAEYYLRTGDKEILPVIQKYADLARDHHYLGGWAHGGTGLFPYMNGGHMNAAGTHVLAFLLLAKECGVNVDEKTLQSSLQQFYRFAGRGLTPYGDALPEMLFVDNGRCAKLALAMAAAASLTPEGEKSLYADARDVSAFKSFTTTPFMNHGHTGGGIGEVWRSMVMGMLYEKRPVQYRSFMKERQWFYELSRRFNGSFGILNGGRYGGAPGTTPEWGHAMGLTYTAPRKTLRITGAKPKKYSKLYQLPKRPWGTAADDEFLSLKACVDKNGNIPAVEDETLENNSSLFVLVKLNKDDITEDEVRYFAHHQEIAIRRLAAYCAAGMKPQYMRQQKPTKARFPKLITELLQSKDARVRHAGIIAVTQLPSELLTDQNFKLIADMVNNPEESWFVTARALNVMQYAKPEQIAPHLDRLLELLEHDEWWLRSAALSSLIPVMTDTKYYAKIFPVVSRVIAANQRYNTLAPLRNLSEQLKTADPKVQKAAVKMLGKAYVDFSQQKQTREVPNLDGETRHLDLIAKYLAPSPGGLEELLKAVETRFPGAPLRHRNEFLGRKENASPAVKKALKPIILDEIVPEHVGKNYLTLVKMRDAKYQHGGFAGGRGDAMDQLVGLYGNAGMTGYDWHNFGPDLRQSEFWYYTFDPIKKEQVPWDQLISRYRRVTMPKGMEKWHKNEFDPKAFGWKKGKAAFGNYNNEIPDYTDSRCVGEGSGCKCGAKVHTLWDKEILLFKGTFKMPEMKPGHRYRLRVNDGDHVGCGGGYEVYINGKKIASSGRPPRRGEGGLPKGAFITEKWIKELSGKEFTIAVKSFIRYNRKYKQKPTKKIPQGRISVHFEEMKIPPFSYDQVISSASLVPMLSAEWQANQFAGLSKNTDEVDVRQGTISDGKYTFSGTFEPNHEALGTWVFMGQVAEVDDFEPGKELAKELPRGRPPFKVITINKGGRTDNPSILWSKDRMMNLSKFEALRMVTKKIGGTDYLFVEAGNFHGPTGIPVGWKSPWSVMKRK